MKLYLCRYGTAGGDDVPNKHPRPDPNAAAATGPLATGDHTHDSTRAWSGGGGSGARPPGGALGSRLPPEDLARALKREAEHHNPALVPAGRPPPTVANLPRLSDGDNGGGAVTYDGEGEDGGGGGGGGGSGAAAPGRVVTPRLAAAYPSWPARVTYGVWRQARGTSEEQRARLLW